MTPLMSDCKFESCGTRFMYTASCSVVNPPISTKRCRQRLNIPGWPCHGAIGHYDDIFSSRSNISTKTVYERDILIKRKSVFETRLDLIMIERASYLHR